MTTTKRKGSRRTQEGYGSRTSLTGQPRHILDTLASLPTDILDTRCRRRRPPSRHALEGDGCDEGTNEICARVGEALAGGRGWPRPDGRPLPDVRCQPTDRIRVGQAIPRRRPPTGGGRRAVAAPRDITACPLAGDGRSDRRDAEVLPTMGAAKAARPAGRAGTPVGTCRARARSRRCLSAAG